MTNGFVKMRRGLEEHLVAGRLSLFELGVYTVVLLQANPATGVWFGSAARVAASVPRNTHRRAVQRALARLAAIGFLRIFRRPGASGNYAVLVDKYEITIGPQAGRRVNAAASRDWRQVVYEPVGGADTGADTAAVAPEGSKTENQKREQAPLRLVPAAVGHWRQRLPAAEAQVGFNPHGGEPPAERLPFAPAALERLRRRRAADSESSHDAHDTHLRSLL